MQQLLILTNSVDGTCDSIVKIMEETNQKFFRWNIDLWQNYEIKFSNGLFNIVDPIGRDISINNSEVKLLWRKPFVSQMNFDNLMLNQSDEDQGKSQIRQWLLALVAIMKPQKRVRLIEPYAEQRLPKLYQLHLASSYFSTPSSHFSINNDFLNNASQTITKPLGDLTIGNENVFYTQLVNKNDLFRPFPWFVQEAIVGGNDVTCVYIHGKSYFYICDFHRNENYIDWRTEINSNTQSQWEPLMHPKISKWRHMVELFMAAVGLIYGRLDFILKHDVLHFLECNTNGQFGWLDSHDNLPLHREFLMAALDPSSAVN